MRRLLVNGRFFGQPAGGVQRAARELLTALARARPEGWALGVVVPARAEAAARAGAPPGVELLVDRAPLGGHAWEQLRLAHWLRRWDGELLWCPANTGPLDVPRQILTIHDAAVFVEPRWFPWAFARAYRWLQPRLGRRVQAVVTVSAFSRDELLRCGVAPAARLHVVPHGVPELFLGPAPPPAEGPRRVLCVGAGSPRKDAPTLLRAWARLPPAARAGRRLTIVGASPARARAASGADIEWTGRVDDARLARLYAAADLLVHPSRHEGFGLPALEALAVGVPVVAARAGALPEVCADAARFFETGDDAALARALAELLGDPEARRELAERGRRRAARFRWADAAAAFLGIVEGRAAAYPADSPVPGAP